MGPAKRKIWLPLVRLAGFFAGIVLTGNLLLHAVYTPRVGEAKVDRTSDYLGRKKRQLERHYRTIERLFHTLSAESVADPAPSGHVAPTPVVPTVSLEVDEFVPVVRTVSFGLAEPVVKPEPTPFVWLEPPAPPAPRSLGLPHDESPLDLPVMTSEGIRRWDAIGRHNPLVDVGDSILTVPELLFDGIFSLAEQLSPRGGTAAGEGSISDRLLDFSVEQRPGRIFTEFTDHLVKREQRYFSRFADSDLSTPGVSDGEQDVDLDDLASDQGKVLWDALKRTYFSKYKVRAESRIRDDAFYFNRWRGVDFVLLPPLMSGYLYYRGLDKKFSVAGTRLQIGLEPLSKWTSGRDEMTAGLTLEWGPKDWPVCLIATAGLHEGDLEMDFIGIGTSAGMAQKTLALAEGD